jgi:hypothetical protein
VASCNNTYSGASTTLCCKSADGCICAYVGCDSDSITNTCSCGFDHGAAILSSQTEVTTCTPPAQGRCCATASEGQCGCDTLATACNPAYGDQDVPSCTTKTVPAMCPAGSVAVDACNK